MKKNKIILIGIPGCGKTTLGQRAAEVLNLPYFDTDVLTSEKLNIQHLHEHFRYMFSGDLAATQFAVVNRLSLNEDKAIIATGAEIALMSGCKRILREMGTIIHLCRNPDTIRYDKAHNDKIHMVMVEKNADGTDGKTIDMADEAVRLYAKELQHYEALADRQIDNNGTEDEGLENLLAMIRTL